MKSSIFRKVAIAAIAVMTMSVAAHAQEKGDMAAGGNIVLGLGDSFTNFGIGAKFQYNILTPLRLEGAFTYFLKKDLVSMWDLSVNAHWLFHVADKITVYPLAGLGVLGSKVNIDLDGFGSASTSSSEFGVNLGGGIDYVLTNKLFLNAELKYKIGGTWDRLLISAGLAYKF
jgi:outer membrane protein X